MPKRIPTPPMESNSNYFVVCFPYPLNANWELDADAITFARWIACCIKQEFFTAILWKPSARGMVLIEIDRTFTDHKILLGEHRWAEFLQKPNKEEKPCSTQIFYSNYSNHRAAQKEGWKTISVQDKWFNDWSINNSIVKQPYPLTHWCQVPVEDATNKKMCRMLPVAFFTPPAKAAKPVVGSKAWVQSTTAPKPDSPEIQRSAWNSGRPSSVNKAPSHSNAASTAPRPQNNNVSVNSSTTPKASSTSKANQGAWGPKPKPQLGAGTKNAWGVTPKLAATTPQHPPGLSASPANPPSAPPGLVRNTSSGSGDSDIASDVAADRAVMANAQYDDLLAGTGRLTVSNSTQNALFGITPDEDPDYESVAAWETPHSTGGVSTIYSVEAEDVKQNLWGDYKVPTRPEDDELECPVHGVICSRGICVAYSELKRKKERAERAAKNPRGGGGRGGVGRKSKGSGNRNGSDGEWSSVNRSGRASSTHSSAHSSRSASRSNAPAAEPVLVPFVPFDHDNEDDPW
ncbi:hypothetical protein BDP27DRAFT_1415252 [Rhodocollybia butyracea]|uniref:Uncharacterized protein n=1 Tax=Rhodocollybia butyracea TaxID=206335 RepID=A0A9P5UEN5_9AGAR|nr:hypothetical protein BDP27DRAFT_1415252 [Rhodocollybia butyracea]